MQIDKTDFRVEITSDLANRLKTAPSEFAATAIRDRVNAFDKGLDILEDWDMNELRWASETLSPENKVADFPHPEKVASDLHVKPAASPSPKEFGISLDRAEELRAEVKESRRVSQALLHVVRGLKVVRTSELPLP